MSAKNCLVVAFHKNNPEPVVVRCPKHEFFSKKEAQRQADAQVRNLGAERALVMEQVLAVNS